MKDLGLFALRATVGGLMMGHGAQKLFGKFGGYGLEGTGGWLESLGMRPGKQWAVAAGGSEFGGGLLTLLGFLHPVGPITMLGPMAMAIDKAHRDKPIWVTEGGAELPVTNIAVAAALAMIGPGRFSLDHLLGTRLAPPLVGLIIGATAAGIAMGMNAGQAATPVQEETAGSELQGGVGASAHPAAINT